MSFETQQRKAAEEPNYLFADKQGNPSSTTSSFQQGPDTDQPTPPGNVHDLLNGCKNSPCVAERKEMFGLNTAAKIPGQRLTVFILMSLLK